MAPRHSFRPVGALQWTRRGILSLTPATLTASVRRRPEGRRQGAQSELSRGRTKLINYRGMPRYLLLLALMVLLSCGVNLKRAAVPAPPVPPVVEAVLPISQP